MTRCFNLASNSDVEVTYYTVTKADGTKVTRKRIKTAGKGTTFQTLGSKGEVTREIKEDKSGNLVDQSRVNQAQPTKEVQGKELQERYDEFNEATQGVTAGELVRQNDVKYTSNRSGKAKIEITRKQEVNEAEKKERLQGFYSDINRGLFSTDIKTGTGTATITYTPVSQRGNDYAVRYGEDTRYTIAKKKISQSVNPNVIKNRAEEYPGNIVIQGVNYYNQKVSPPILADIDKANEYIKSKIPKSTLPAQRVAMEAGADFFFGLPRRYVKNPSNIAVDYYGGKAIGAVFGFGKGLVTPVVENINAEYRAGKAFTKGIGKGISGGVGVAIGVPIVIDVVTNPKPSQRAGELAGEFFVVGKGFISGYKAGEVAGVEAAQSIKRSRLNAKYKGQLTTSTGTELSRDVKGFTVKGEPVESINFYGQQDSSGTVTGYKVNFGKTETIKPEDLVDYNYYRLSVQGERSSGFKAQQTFDNKLLADEFNVGTNIFEASKSRVYDDFIFNADASAKFDEAFYLSKNKAEGIIQTGNLARFSSEVSGVPVRYRAKGIIEGTDFPTDLVRTGTKSSYTKDYKLLPKYTQLNVGKSKGNVYGRYSPFNKSAVEGFRYTFDESRLLGELKVRVVETEPTGVRGLRKKYKATRVGEGEGLIKNLEVYNAEVEKGFYYKEGKINEDPVKLAKKKYKATRVGEGEGLIKNLEVYNKQFEQADFFKQGTIKEDKLKIIKRENKPIRVGEGEGLIKNLEVYNREITLRGREIRKAGRQISSKFREEEIFERGVRSQRANEAKVESKNIRRGINFNLKYEKKIKFGADKEGQAFKELFGEGKVYSVKNVEAKEIIPKKKRIFRIQDFVPEKSAETIVSESGNSQLLLQKPIVVAAAVSATKQLKKSKTKTTTNKVSVLGSKQAESTQEFKPSKSKSESSFDVQTKKVYRVKSDSLSKVAQRYKSGTSLSYASASKLVQQSKIGQSQKQGQFQAFQFDTSQKYEFKPSFDITNIQTPTNDITTVNTPRLTTTTFIPEITRTPGKNPPGEPPKIKIPSFPKGNNGFGGFDVFVRRRGEFRSIARNVGIQEAQTLALRNVGNTAAASFKIIGNGIINIPTPQGFYASKKEPGVYIEKPSRRIKSTGELREITFEGIKANKQRKKKRYNGFGGLF